MSTKNQNNATSVETPVTKLTAAELEKLYNEANAETAKGSRDVYNFQGKEISKIFESCGHSDRRTRGIFRETIKKRLFKIVSQNTEQKRQYFAKRFWEEFGDCFYSPNNLAAKTSKEYETAQKVSKILASIL